jgi:hypothetical protein
MWKKQMEDILRELLSGEGFTEQKLQELMKPGGEQQLKKSLKDVMSKLRLRNDGCAVTGEKSSSKENEIVSLARLPLLMAPQPSRNTLTLTPLLARTEMYQ